MKHHCTSAHALFNAPFGREFNPVLWEIATCIQDWNKQKGALSYPSSAKNYAWNRALRLATKIKCQLLKVTWRIESLDMKETASCPESGPRTCIVIISNHPTTDISLYNKQIKTDIHIVVYKIRNLTSFKPRWCPWWSQMQPIAEIWNIFQWNEVLFTALDTEMIILNSYQLS